MDLTLIQDFMGANNPREAILEAMKDEERPFTAERTLKALDAVWNYAGKAENISRDGTSETALELALDDLFRAVYIIDGATYQKLMVDYGNAVYAELLETPEIVSAFKAAFGKEWEYQLAMLAIDIENAEENNIIDFHLDRFANA